MGDPDASEEQPKVIVDLSGSSDSRARRSGGIALTNGDRWSDSKHFIDFRSFDAFEELSCIRRKRLDVSPLAFGIDGVEGKRGFTGAAHARNDGQRIVGNLKVDVLEIVNPNAA